MSISCSNNGGYLEALTTILDGASEFTLSTWIKSNATGVDSGWITHAFPDGRDRFVNMRYDADGLNSGNVNNIKVGIELTGGVEHNMETVGNVQTTDWQHVAMRWQSGSDIEIYIDGDFSNDPAGGSGSNTGTISGFDRVIIGEGVKDEVPGQSWDGLIEDVRLFDRYLSEEEIQTIYATAGTDNIVDGLIYRYKFNEDSVGATIPTTAGFVKDSSNHSIDLTRQSNTITYGERFVRYERKYKVY